MEKIKKKRYEFDTDQYGVPIFTKKNLDFVQALIENDSKYRILYDHDNEKFEESYVGLLEKHRVSNDSEIMKKIVKSIDKYNSTHLASEGKSGGGRGIDITVKAILKIDDLKGKLERKDDDIVKEIALAVKNEKQKNKVNFSFATKFCAYTSIGALKQDNYCIYDTVVQNILPYYAYVYLSNDRYYRTNRNGKNCSTIETQFKENLNYKGYRELIDDIIASIKKDIESEVTYQQFDNLLWYYFKGDNGRIESAMKHLPQKNK